MRMNRDGDTGPVELTPYWGEIELLIIHKHTHKRFPWVHLTADLMWVKCRRCGAELHLPDEEDDTVRHREFLNTHRHCRKERRLIYREKG